MLGSVITSLKMKAAGVMQFLLVDEKDKLQQSDNGVIIFGHGITRVDLHYFCSAWRWE